jgi:hypothetical protein
VVKTGDAVVALDGEHSTLSEIAIALDLGKPVISLANWSLPKDMGRDIVDASSPANPVNKAIRPATDLKQVHANPAPRRRSGVNQDQRGNPRRITLFPCLGASIFSTGDPFSKNRAKRGLSRSASRTSNYARQENGRRMLFPLKKGYPFTTAGGLPGVANLVTAASFKSMPSPGPCGG